MESSLRNRFFAFSVVLFLVVLCAQCTQSANKESENISEVDSANCSPKMLNPNGDSELAVLMREMTTYSERVKANVLEGKTPEKYPDSFLNLHVATPTDSTVRTPEFHAFAAEYLTATNVFVNSPVEKLTLNYNNMLTSCVNCHSAYCIGPVKRINRLKIAS